MNNNTGIIMSQEKKKRGRKRKNKRYFTDITEAAIVAYNQLDPDDSRRSKIYQRFIYYPFDKLAEFLINTFKMQHFNMPFTDIKNYLVAHFVEKIHMYQKQNGKAFSYFTRIGINWLIIGNKDAYKEKLRYAEVSALDVNRDLQSEVAYNDYQQELQEFTKLFTTYYDANLATFFPKKKDMRIAEAILWLFSNTDSIEKYNKKALYVLIRERARISDTQYITKIVISIKKNFNHMFSEYRKTGYFTPLETTSDKFF